MRGVAAMTAVALLFASTASARADLEKANSVQPGDTRQRVLEVMGAPGKVEKFGELEAVQYCKSGFTKAQYVRFRLKAGAVVSVDRYSKYTDLVGRCANGYEGTSFGSAG